MICLNMIVKNEAADIGRCLASVKPFIGYYLIADTGSTDGTPDIIKRCLTGIKGEILHHDWVNFGHNRERILQCAYAHKWIDYCLIIDADEELKVKDKAAFKNLTADCYYIERQLGSTSYKLPALINIRNVNWHWKGVVHNYLVGSNAYETLDNVVIIPYSGKGGKSSGVSSKEKYLRDAGLLEQELKKNPNDSRSVFYLAQSYRDVGYYQKAYENYIRRVNLGGWDEEVYEAMYQAAVCKWRAEAVFALDDFLAAYNYRPSRAEPLHEIAKYYRQTKMYALAYLFAKVGVEIPYPSDKLFVRRDVYEWRLLDELAISAYWTGQYKESEEICNKLLLAGKLPEREVARVTQNRDYARRELAKQ